MTDIGYVWQKLFEAVSGLATGSGRIQERLGMTATSLAVLNPEDFKDANHRKSFSEFVEAMHSHEDPTMGSFWASARAMSDDEASAWASKLFSLFHDVALEMGKRRKV
jgi:hypothetical protein